MTAQHTDSSTPASACPFGADYSVARMHTRDADEQAANLRHWDQTYEQLSPGRFRGLLHQVCFSDVQVFREVTNQCLVEEGMAWRGSFSIALPVTMRGEGYWCGERFGTEHVLALRGDRYMDFRTPRELDVLAITVDARALRDYADEVEHRDLDAEVPENRVLKTDADRREGLASLLESALATLDATPAVLGHRQAQDNLRESLLNRILGTLAPDCAGGRPHAHAGRQQLVARAKDYIREHLDQTLTVADLCKALNVSRRTLQYSFEEVLDLNPVRYLLALRLNGARRDLKSADPSSASVQDIAASWGFWHLSRFSHYYKGMFGELPSETLRARSAPAATAIPEVVPRTGLAGA